MAPPTKRKRGRPSNASREQADASQTGAALSDTTNLPPRKRTRRSLENENSRNGATAAEADAPVKKKGRARAGKATITANEAPATEQPEQPKKKRGRPSLQNKQADEERSAPEPKKRKGRSPLEDRQANENVEVAASKKRGRPSLRGAEVDEGAQAEEPTKKRGSAKSQEASKEAQTAQRNKKRRRPSPASTSTSEPFKSTAAKGKRSSRRQSGDSQASQETTSASLYRRRSSLTSAVSADREPSPPPSPAKPYAHLAPRVRRIRRSHIAAKWSPLAPSSIALTTSLLTLAHRPILQRLSSASSSQRLTHTAAALRLITKRITRRLQNALPFPPPGAPGTTRETEFNFEAVLGRKEKLEKQLDPALHAVELLRKEKSRLERELERDYETLRNLEAGASQEAREKGRLLKKAHPLAPKRLRTEREVEEAEIHFARDQKHTGNVFTGIEDDDLKDTVMQLSGHMESMKTNLQQVDGVKEGVERSRAAVQEVLLRHLGQEQYEQVILG